MFSHRTAWNFSPNRFSQAHRELLDEGRELLDLTVSNPTRAQFAYDGPSILQALNHPESLDYDPQPKGLLSARRTVACYYSQPPAAQVDAESILLTTSTSEGYSYVFRLLCNPGEQVLVPKPSYPLFDFLADLQDIKLVPYPLLYDHGWQIDFPSLQKAVTERTRAIVLVHPNNPTGSYVSAEERATLNEFCAQHSLALIVDEVFLDYAHEEARPSFAANREALTFTLSGVSKISGLPQMKLAWIVVAGPDEVVRPALERLEVIADTYLSMNAPIQYAASALLDQRYVLQPQLMQRVRANLEELDRQLSRQTICERLRVQGGWYAVLRVPVLQSDEDLAIQLLRHASVMVHPGHFYDFPSDGYLVLSLIGDPADFAEAVARLLETLNS